MVVGRVPSPIGYINADRNTLDANVKPDPKNFGHVRRAFELAATGRFTEAALLRQLMCICRFYLDILSGHLLDIFCW